MSEQEKRTFDILAEMLDKDGDGLTNATTATTWLDAIKQMQTTICRIAEAICTDPPRMTEDLSKEEKSKLLAAAKIISANKAFFASMTADLEELKPYFESVLQGPQYAEYAGKPISELLAQTPDGSSLLQKALDEARDLREKSIPRATHTEAKKVIFPVDKINSNLWDCFTDAKPNGQLSYAFDVTARKTSTNHETDLIVSLDFDGLKDASISKQLDPFDKRVYIAINDLWRAGNEIVTATSIYNQMGNVGKPDTRSVEKIIQSVKKMASAFVTWDNQSEHDRYGKMPHLKYGGSLLPIEWVESYINGKRTNAAIHIFRAPPLMEFAQARKQITTFPKKLLQSPISKTNAHILIEDNLLELMTAAKNGKINSFVTWETLYKRCQITTKVQKSRLPETIKIYLDWYVKCGHIKKYKMDNMGVTFMF